MVGNIDLMDLITVNPTITIPISSDKIRNVTNTLLSNAKNLNSKYDLSIFKGKVGVYTENETDAASLAYLVGAGIENDSAEWHGTSIKKPGYQNQYTYTFYRHFHDINHKIHVWYGGPVTFNHA